MGTLIMYDKNPYCDALEYQFVGMKTDDSSTITVPWKKNATAENNNAESSTNPKSTLEKEWLQHTKPSPSLRPHPLHQSARPRTVCW
jgi:hypothetical protein